MLMLAFNLEALLGKDI